MILSFYLLSVSGFAIVVLTIKVVLNDIKEKKYPFSKTFILLSLYSIYFSGSAGINGLLNIQDANTVMGQGGDENFIRLVFKDEIGFILLDLVLGAILFSSFWIKRLKVLEEHKLNKTLSD